LVGALATRTVAIFECGGPLIRLSFFSCVRLLQNEPMIYGYARVSTDGQSEAAQVRQLRAAGAKKVYREVASGTKTDRPQLRRLLAEVGPGDVVTVTRLDRLARSTRDLLNTLAAITGRAELSRVLATDAKLTIAGFREYAHFMAPEVLGALRRRPAPGWPTGEVSRRAPAILKVCYGCAPWKGGTFPVGERPTR
jgi:hypothetical protein